VIPIETRSKTTLFGNLALATLNLSHAIQNGAIQDSTAWIKQAAERLLRAAAPGQSRTKTARRLAPEMREAHWRREVDTYLGWNHIRTILSTNNWGPVKKPKRRVAPDDL
jgi:hypothetical protein